MPASCVLLKLKRLDNSHGVWLFEPPEVLLLANSAVVFSVFLVACVPHLWPLQGISKFISEVSDIILGIWPYNAV